MTSPGFFMTFHGVEGSGKSTQTRLLAQTLQEAGFDVLLTREPGSIDPVCQRIREILLDVGHTGRISYSAELLLFLADRAQHLEHIVLPALHQGKIVLSDRHEADTFAYQCIARGVCTKEEFFNLSIITRRGIRPHFSMYLDVDPEQGLSRNKSAGKRDRLELEDLDFHRRVREGFEYWFEHLHGPDWCRIDGMVPQEEIQRAILEYAIKRIPGLSHALSPQS